MLHPLLPRLKPDTKVTTFSNAGRWEARNSAELERVSADLEVTRPKATSSEVNSIPSMWARPLLFEMALYDNRHPIHDLILGEWRGLLAMLALKEWCEFPLTIDHIEITSAKNSPDAKDFLESLYTLCLHLNKLDPKTTWETLNIISFNGKPIGITSPTTLVCTSVNYFGRISDVPWFNGQHLENPIPELNKFEKNAVAGWLRHLYDSIRNLPVEKIKTSIMELLDKFIGDLGGDAAVSNFSRTSLGLKQDLFECMDHPVAEPEPADIPSSVELISSKGKQPETRLLLLDPAIPDAWKEKPQNVIVWKGKTLATIGKFGGKPELKLPSDVDQRSQEDFFTEKLFVVNQGGAFHKDNTLAPKGSDGLKFHGIDVTPLLPISPELLTYLDVTELNERVTFVQQKDSIKVSLKLTLSGINGEKPFVISKEYAAADVEGISTGPILAIWPNFRTRDWKAYYTYFTTAGQNTFYAKPFVTADQTFIAQKVSDQKEIIKTEHFPEAMVCNYNGNEAGILLISVPEAKSGDGTVWNVGVDFGTSSTTVYKRKGNAQPEQVTFNERLLRITESLADLDSAFYDDFVSPNSEGEETPFLSLFQKLGDQKEPSQPLLDGHIYFLEKKKGLSAAEHIINDLKWSTNVGDRRYIKVFLKQLCLQCAAEAVDDGSTEINWNFSHPLAFTENDSGEFELAWEEDVGPTCESMTGLAQKVMTPAQSESVVTAKFFATKPPDGVAAGGFATGAVCIDIGGETSDISIWKRNRLYWQTSLRFAGRHIFLDLLKENLALLKKFDVDDKDINDLSKVTNDRFYTQADALIKDEGREWLAKLGDIGREDAVQRFTQLISLGVAGLLYYVGLLLNHLSQTTDFGSGMPSIYIGGNGSKILHWMASGNFGKNKVAMLCREYLRRVILKASGFDTDHNSDVEISREPKQEAAYGLVADGVELEVDETQFDILAGETFRVAEADYEWDEILTTELLSRRVETSKYGLEQIENFIENFNEGFEEKFDKPVDLNETLSGKADNSSTVKGAMFQQLENRLQQFGGKNPKEISAEPLFILALKELLKAKTRQVDN